MDKGKNAPHSEAKSTSSKTNIHVSSEYYQEKAGHAAIRRQSKCRATQNPQHRLRIFQHEKMTIASEARKCREKQAGARAAPRFHLSTPQAVLLPRQVPQILTRGPGFPTTRISVPTDCIREGYCRIMLQYTRNHQCADENIRLPSIPCPSGLGTRTG
jgi:hypothetical protein